MSRVVVVATLSHEKPWQRRIAVTFVYMAHTGSVCGLGNVNIDVQTICVFVRFSGTWNIFRVAYN